MFEWLILKGFLGFRPSVSLAKPIRLQARLRGLEKLKGRLKGETHRWIYRQRKRARRRLGETKEKIAQTKQEILQAKVGARSRYLQLVETAVQSHERRLEAGRRQLGEEQEKGDRRVKLPLDLGGKREEISPKEFRGEDQDFIVASDSALEDAAAALRKNTARRPLGLAAVQTFN